MTAFSESTTKRFPLRLFTREELERIYQASLRVLEEVGMQLDHPHALDILEGEGARIDRKKNRAYFPPELIVSKLSLVPREFTYHGRTPEFDYTASLDGPMGARSNGGCVGYLDIETGIYRRANLADWRQINQLADALPNIRGVGNLHCGDVPMETSDIHSVRALLESGRKCAMHGAATAKTFRYQVELLLAARGSREALSERSQVHHNITVTNPLFLTYDHLEQLFIAVEYDIPIDIPVMSIVGITSPITIAGTLVQNLAEELGTIALIQSIKPRFPVAFFTDPVIGNMRTADIMCGAPEAALLIAGICQIGSELFGLPTETIGFDTDGRSSAQTMLQKAQNLIFQAMAGGKMVVGCGCVESILTLCPVQLVLDDELMAIAQRLTRKIVVDDNSLAVEAIKRVGPRGCYLMDEHTLEGVYAGEIMELELSERDSRREAWEASGMQTMETMAREKAKAIVRDHIVPPLPDNVLREFETIIKSADAELA